MVLKNLLTGRQWKNRHREQTYGHGERGGEGEIHGESNMETYQKKKKKKHTLILQNILDYLNTICCLLFWGMILARCL